MYEIKLMADGSRLVGDVLLGLVPYPSDFTLRLFKSGIAPTAADALSLYLANEADYSGYLAQAIGGWTFQGIQGGRYTWTAAARTFVVAAAPSVGNNIGGYFVTYNGGTKFGWAQQLPGEPYAMALFGHQLILPPLLTFRSEFA